ncbi:hypothetical protein GUJ93_ZPchr0010g9229 [Zizania palustris]|uniref:Uncharacterized protein n=1 Tax=Zizania palustris TaxID=103762 RepID=A0A8J5W9S8_ZIZPA|nr:hypothetical protein GUJ93_ZPchr0010g9229 [Zizania palustris]
MALQQGDNSAMWLHGAGSRAASAALPPSHFYGFQGQSQQGGFRQGQATAAALPVWRPWVPDLIPFSKRSDARAPPKPGRGKPERFPDCPVTAISPGLAAAHRLLSCETHPWLFAVASRAWRALRG